MAIQYWSSHSIIGKQKLFLDYYSCINEWNENIPCKHYIYSPINLIRIQHFVSCSRLINILKPTSNWYIVTKTGEIAKKPPYKYNQCHWLRFTIVLFTVRRMGACRFGISKNKWNVHSLYEAMNEKVGAYWGTVSMYICRSQLV